jgi:multiple sugar transport system ATP-binding protein
MSISDLIVVMEAGVVQQIAKPQLVYEDPINLFVAKFLGTPPINVFEGKVKGGIVYIGEDAVIKAEPDSSWKEGAPDAAPGVALKDGPVTIGIRPEGFDPEKDGELSCGLTAVEVMGRDTSIVATNAHAANGSIRTIVSTEELAEVSGETVNFRIKPSRIYLFDHETGARVRCRFTPLR